MTSSISPSPRTASSPEAAEIVQLRDMLKRCSPETFAAACEFRRTRDVAQLRPVIVGVIERYVEREFRPKLATGDESLRLVEDLGVDSLTMMEIVLLAEDVLHISVTNEELVHLRTIGDVREFVTAKVSAPAPASVPAPTPALG